VLTLAWQVVPVETASSELERAAATLRPKLHRHLPRFLVDIPRVALTHPSVQTTYSSSTASPEALEEVDVSDPERALASLQVDRSVRHQRVCDTGIAKAPPSKRVDYQQILELRSSFSCVICSYGNVKAYAHGSRP
jgi:hypothetical protein